MLGQGGDALGQVCVLGPQVRTAVGQGADEAGRVVVGEGQVQSPMAAAAPSGRSVRELIWPASRRRSAAWCGPRRSRCGRRRGCRGWLGRVPRGYSGVLTLRIPIAERAPSPARSASAASPAASRSPAEQPGTSGGGRGTGPSGTPSSAPGIAARTRLTGWGCIKDMASRTGTTTPAHARWDTGAVLACAWRLPAATDSGPAPAPARHLTRSRPTRLPGRTRRDPQDGRSVRARRGVGQAHQCRAPALHRRRPF